MAQQGKEFAAESDSLSTVPGPTQCKLTSMGVPWYTHPIRASTPVPELGSDGAMGLEDIY